MWNYVIPGISREQARPTPDTLRRETLIALQERLPSSWKLREVGKEHTAQSRHEALWELRVPDGAVTRLYVAVKQQLEPRAVTPLLLALQRDDRRIHPFVIASFLGPHARDMLSNADAGYADAAGNLRLHLDSPPIFIDIGGANIDPWRESRPLYSLKGPAAGRAVRALCDFRPPYGTLEIAERSHTAPATMSRVISFLSREALLTRMGRGTITTVDWRRLIERWTQDYTFTRSNHLLTYLEPRGLDALLNKLRTVSWRYAVTGSLATRSMAPIAAARLATVYVEDSERAATILALRPVEAGANVLLAEPFDPVVFERTIIDAGVTYAALSQVAADLLTSPGRGPAEGMELLQWMEEHQDVWRC